MAAGCSEAKFAHNILKEVGLNVGLHLATDSSSAIYMVYRRGVGRVRHLGVKQLWLQEGLRAKEFTLTHVPGSQNVSDLFTKACMTATTFENWVKLIGLRRWVLEPSVVAALLDGVSLRAPLCPSGHGELILVAAATGLLSWVC